MLVYKLTSEVNGKTTFHGIFSNIENGKEAARKVWKKLFKSPFSELADTYWCDWEGCNYNTLSLSICMIDELE